MLKHPAFKKGATSIYVVVISTLLFSVITFSFIRIIIDEVTKTTNDELAQAAYDSALAGIEDAKTALKRYYDCKSLNLESLSAEDQLQCKTIIDVFDAETKGFNSTNGDTDYCDTIAEALGRVDETKSSYDDSPREVLIQEQSKTGGDRENIIQAYTCVTVDDTLDDYRGTLSASSSVRVVPLTTDDPDSVTGVRIFWYSEEDGSLDERSLNFSSKDSFHPIGSSGDSKPIPTPPTISAQIIQTGPDFTLDSFQRSIGGRTNRGTVVLVPTKGTSEKKTHISASTFVDSNNHDYSRSSQNDPQKIECLQLSDEFACGASIELTKPIGSDTRNKETFYLILTLPYGNPTTSFAVQLCNDSEPGGVRGDCMVSNSTSIAQFRGVQIAIDSTGRANDLYSRVEARIEFRDNFMFPEFAIHATGEGEDSLKKNFYVTDDCIDTTDPNNIKSCDDTTR
ncbi:hypothetical protein IKG20_00355 [Candidatus Saccharibacteria bacterium]|nr:hypothetical protein [Candidatus Saccharibacteria bacterium]